MKDTLLVPLLDLGFVISATATEAADNFVLMKETIQSILDEYGVKKVRYAVITFDDTAVIHLKFKSNDALEKSLKGILHSLPSTSGTPNLNNALAKGLELFSKQEGGRPGARKALVLMIDRKTTESKEQLTAKAEELVSKGIHLIPVVIGSEVQPGDLALVAPNKEIIITTNKIEDPNRLGKRVIHQILISMSLYEVKCKTLLVPY